MLHRFVDLCDPKKYSGMIIKPSCYYLDILFVLRNKKSFSSITVLALYADIQKNFSLKENNSTAMRHTPQDLKKIIIIIIWQNRLFKTINDTSKVINTDDKTTVIAESKIDVTLLPNIQ